MSAAYQPQEAARVAYASMPQELRQQLTPDDVLYLLFLEFQFYATAALPDSPDVAPAASAPRPLEHLVAYMVDAAAQQGRSFTAEQIAYVLRGEDMYLRQLGIMAS